MDRMKSLNMQQELAPEVISSTSSVTPPLGDTSLWGTLAGNPYFSAGFGLLGVGTALAVLRQGAMAAAVALQRNLLVNLEIASKDASYQWFLEWLGEQQRLQRSANRKFSALALLRSTVQVGRQRATDAEPPVQMIPSHDLSVQTLYKKHDNGHMQSKFNFVPGPGRHYFTYKSAWFQMERKRERNMVDLHNASPWETIRLTTLSRDRQLISEMLEMAQRFATTRLEGKTVLYTSWGPEWRPFGLPRRRRPLSSVVCDEGIAESVVCDIEQFIGNGAWYHERGIPYRRGYLLYGPPGSGKSSFIQALAGHLEYNICILNISDSGLTDDRLNHLLATLPVRSFVLLEDIDAAFHNRQQTDMKGYGQSLVTFSGLLNALDGVASAEERIVFMTTNHVDRLDAALVRPGRIDRKFIFDNASEHQIRTIFRRYFDSPSLEEEFVSDLKRRGWIGKVSMAQLQGLFIQFYPTPEQLLSHVHQLLEA